MNTKEHRKNNVINFIKSRPDQKTKVDEIMVGCCNTNGIIDFEETREIIVSMIDTGEINYSINGDISIPKKFKVIEYGMQGYDDFCVGEFDTLEEALHEIRKEWPYPQKLTLPNGEVYDFTKEGEEWNYPVILKYIVLKSDKRNPRQNHLIKEISGDPDFKMFLSRLSHKPMNYDEIIDDDLKEKQMDMLLKLITYDLIEFVDFYDGMGIRDIKWRDIR